MEVVLGALPSLLPKLAELLAAEYNLQKEVKGGIMFLQAELETMKAALEDISKTPADQLSSQDRIWAKNVRELSYDIEDHIDTFITQVKGREPTKKHGLKNYIDRALGSMMQPKIHRKIATDIRAIKSHLIEVHERRRRYEVNLVNVDKPIKVDSRALVLYEEMRNLVGIDKARDEVIKILIEGNDVSKPKDKILSIVGIGGLGKTTLANVVYEKLKAQFDCSAFVSVSQTPDMDKLFKDMFHQLAKYNATSINVLNEIREFLQDKRYFIIVDDVWEISYWNMIRCSLPDDSGEHRIITTTRIFNVAEQIGLAYMMKPLSLENSRTLMYGRIFGKEHNAEFLDEQLVQVSDKILKKCAGVPLAIIAIASLLVTKGTNKLEWYDVCNSMGAGLEENKTVENMRKVLSLSYYDMPSHLRTCLLYLSMFPEDYKIYKDRLVLLWIAEGFIQSAGKQDKSLFDIGESYFYELVNRSMIQLMYDRYSVMVEYCLVHDMVLDLIHSLSSEENFVTKSHDLGHSSASKRVRRLSLENGKVCHGKHEATMNTEHVRSVVIFPPAMHLVPNLQNFRVLRVLDLEDCDLSQCHSLVHIGNLLQLRYLGLRNTHIDQLPEEIGNLQLLQTLDVWGYQKKFSSLPPTILLLRHLMCLRISFETRVPIGIGSLTALEHLSLVGIRNDNTDIIEELGHLTELKVLRIFSFTKWNNEWDKSLVECLNKLHKIRSLQIEVYCGECKCNLDGWVILSPRHLRRLVLLGCWLSVLPTWVNPLLLLDLSLLHIRVRGLQQEDLKILGMLPSLCHLELSVDHEDLGIQGRFVVGASMFPCLVSCTLEGFGGPVVFQQGAMPGLAELCLELPVPETREINGGFDLGLGNLPLLQEINVHFRSGGASKEELEEAKSVVMHAIEVHPNHPNLSTYDIRR